MASLMTSARLRAPRARWAVLVGVAGIAACGGGGGSGGVQEPPPPAPPTVTATISSAKAAVGSDVVIGWSSTGAASCAVAELAWTGLEAQGSRSLRVAAGGRFSYTVSCTGPGGTASQAVSLVVPLPVQATSYLNYKQAGLDPRVLPLMGNARGFADFEQEGRLSYVVHTLEYSPPNTIRGHVRLFRLLDGDRYTEITSALIDGDNTGCLHPRKALVADFNGDRRPDVFFACHGWDSVDPPPASQPLGEFPVLMLSQPDGRYRLSRLAYSYTGPRQPYLHCATAVDGDGQPELWAAGQDNPSDEPFGGLQSSGYRMSGDLNIARTPTWTFPVRTVAATPLDISVRSHVAYFVRVPPAYDRYVVEEVDLRTMAGRIIHTNTVDFGSLAPNRPECIGMGGAWLDFARITADGLFIADDSCRTPNLRLSP